MLGRSRVHLSEKACEEIELPLKAPGAARAGDLGQPAVDLDNGRRLAPGLWCEPLGRDTQVTDLPVEPGDLLLGRLICRRDRRDEQPFAEADLDRCEERRKPAL